MAQLTFSGKPVLAGEAVGEILASLEPLSFWGGYNWETGEITDRHHSLSGARGSGRILAIPFSRGSSTTTAVLLEAIRAGTAPKAILTVTNDFFFALASVVASELYNQTLPIVALPEADFASLQTGDWAEIETNGTIRVRREAIADA